MKLEEEVRREHQRRGRLRRPLIYLAGAIAIVTISGAAYIYAVRPSSIELEGQGNETPAAQVTRGPQSQLESALNDIRAREPEVADALQDADWVANGVTEKEAYFIKQIMQDTERGYYSAGSITRPDGTVTTVVVRDADGPGKRDEALAFTQQYLPIVEKLLGIQYNKSLLRIQFLPHDLAKDSDINFWSIGIPETSDTKHDITTQEISDLEHRLVDAVFEFSESQDPNTPSEDQRVYPTSWVAAGLPELVSRHLKGGDALVEQGRQEVEAAFKSAGITSIVSSKGYEVWKHEGFTSVRNPTYFDGSFLLLAEYKNMIGYDAFWEAMREVYELKVERGTLQQSKPNSQIGLQELGKLLARHVPQERLGGYLEYVPKEKVDDFLAKDMTLRHFWPLYQLRVLGEGMHFQRDQ